MLGQGIMPRQHHPVADLMGDEELSRFLEGIRSSVERTVLQLPKHQAYRRAVLQGAGRAPRGRRVKRASANIYEVAELAGVSLATVSRVVNTDASVSEKTRQKVLSAMLRLGYQPNSIAQSLATRSSNASACWSRSCTAHSSARC